ncbi:hypothetical protein J2Z24_001200 [Clostridium tetanomorphum]|nr:hypothetical protein [Clostridium tetanomorphum]
MKRSTFSPVTKTSMVSPDVEYTSKLSSLSTFEA